MFEFPGGRHPTPDLSKEGSYSPPLFERREDIPTLNDKCISYGINPICFLEGRDDKIYAVSDKCKGCLMIQTKCEHCRKELSYDFYNWAIKLSDQMIDVEGPAVCDLLIHPILERDLLFCGLGCLKMWVRYK
jgi:hypothetical protein